MAKDYLATEKDLNAINEALHFVWHPKMKFVFRKKSKIANTVVVSYDSNSIYLWTQKPLRGLETFKCSLKEYFTYKMPHNLHLKEKWQYAWCAGLWDKSIEKILPVPIKKASQFVIPRISGGLVAPFIDLQKKRSKDSSWPYTTRESYLATIIHEFGHAYWNQHKLWWYSNKEENIKYLTTAKILYQNQKRTNIPDAPFFMPLKSEIGELFAFCTEYYASSIFWPGHKKALDKFAKERIEKLIKKEKEKDLEKDDSVLEPSRNLHDFALVFGKIMLERYPQTWPHILTLLFP